MDPNATLSMINDADTHSEALDACEALWTWLRNGGFAPDWLRCLGGTGAFAEWLDCGTPEQIVWWRKLYVVLNGYDPMAPE